MGATILFDGVCNFCNGAVNFVIERDKTGYFKFAPLQSETGKRLVREHGINTADADSIIVSEDGRVYLYSDAAFRIARKLDGGWSWLRVLAVIPRPIRDSLYKIFAKYRYKLFGRTDQCMLPTPDVRARFLTEE